MSRTQVTPWLRRPYPATSWAGVELVEVDPAYVPIILADLEPRKAASLWTDAAAWAEGYTAIVKQQEALLMGAKEELIIEVRDTRSPGPHDLTTWPVGTFPGTRLEDILGALGGPFANLDAQLTVIRGLSEEMRDLLTQIRDQGGTASEGQLDALLQIVALLSV